MREKISLISYIVGNKDWDVSQETRPDREPLSIRGHHFENLQSILYDKAFPNPDDNAGDMAKRVTQKILDSPSILYRTDMLGNPSDSGDELKQKLSRYFLRFLTLPDDYPVEILGAAPDTLCLSCPVYPNHCHSESHNGANAISGEARYVNLFIDYTKENSIAVKPMRSRNHYRDSQKHRDTMVYGTDLGTVKAFLKHIDPMVLKGEVPRKYP